MNREMISRGSALALFAHRAQRLPPSLPVHSPFARAVAAFKVWQERSRSRDELARFDDFQLMDIGLSKSQAMFESGKSFLER